MKTIEQLAQEVANLQMGVSSPDDLAALFAEPPEVAQQSQEGPTPAVVQPPTPTPALEPQPAPQQVVEPPRKPVILEQVPDKFKDENVEIALQKAVKSYTDLEAEFKKQAAEVARLQKIVSTVTTPESIPTTPQPVRQIQPTQRPGAVIPTIDLGEVIPDAAYFETPGEAITKKARQEALIVANELMAQRILEYHDWMTRQTLIREFRKEHPDFDELREDMIAIAQARPDIDRMPPDQSLPALYSLAKERARLRIESMKKTLGIPEPTPVSEPTPVPQPLNEEAMMEKLMVRIAEEVKKRRAASGITGAPAAVQPDQRSTEQPKEQPKTYSEEVFDRMMAAGPKHPDQVLGLGPGVKRI